MVGTNKILCTTSSWLETDESAGWERVAPEVLMGRAAEDGTSVGDADVELVGLVGLVTDVRKAILMFEHLFRRLGRQP